MSLLPKSAPDPTLLFPLKGPLAKATLRGASESPHPTKRLSLSPLSQYREQKGKAEPAGGEGRGLKPDQGRKTGGSRGEG